MVLRGHHLICLHFFDGEGYNEKFVENLRNVVGTVEENGVEVVTGADDVCMSCPFISTDFSCRQSAFADEEITMMDEAAVKLLGFKPGDRVYWDGVRELLPGVFPEWYKTYCMQCSWRSVCNKNCFFSDLARGLWRS